MSDDEYYAGSPYDDFEDMLWDADPAPDLADDLAQHAAYSPVWQDDPTGELEAYHSDWEYYSDDYYDDDPSILKDNPVDGSSVHGTRTNKFQAPKRGKKRKYEDIKQEKPDAEEYRFLAKTIQGTVWASGRSHETKVFQEGQQETVGLLVNWKEKFKLDNGQSRTFGQGQLRRDESWANDLSLVDMGLTQIHERVGTNNSMDDEAGNVALDDDEEGEGQGEEDVDLDAVQDLEESETSVSGEQQQAVLPDLIPQQNGHQQSQEHFRDQNERRLDHEEMPETESNDDLPDNKRQRISTFSTPSQKHQRGHAVPKEGNPRPAFDSREVGGFTQTRQGNGAKHEQRRADSDEGDVQHPQKNLPRDHSETKKRRLSSDQEDYQHTTRPKTGRRSKRVASAKLRVNEDSHRNDETHPPVTRSMKLRKK